MRYIFILLFNPQKYTLQIWLHFCYGESDIQNYFMQNNVKYTLWQKWDKTSQMQNFSRKRRKTRKRQSTLIPSQGKHGEHEFFPFLSQECTKVRRALEISSSRSLWLWDSHQRQFLSLLFLLFPSWILWCPERVTYDAVLTVCKQKFIGYIIFVQKMSIVPLDLLIIFFFFCKTNFWVCGL